MFDVLTQMIESGLSVIKDQKFFQALRMQYKNVHSLRRVKLSSQLKISVDPFALDAVDAQTKDINRRIIVGID